MLAHNISGNKKILKENHAQQCFCGGHAAQEDAQRVWDQKEGLGPNSVTSGQLLNPQTCFSAGKRSKDALLVKSRDGTFFRRGPDSKCLRSEATSQLCC